MSTRTILQDRLAKKEASLEKAYETYDELLSDGNESYRFDSGEGSQSTKKRKLEELKKQIDYLESEIDGIRRRLSGFGLTKVTVNRRPFCRRR